MIGVGSASVLSRAIGKKDQDTVKKIMGNLEDRCVCCRLNAHAVGFEQGDKNGVEDNVEDRAAGDNGHCLFKLALAANDHICRHGSVSAVLYPGRVVPGQSAFHVHYNEAEATR